MLKRFIASVLLLCFGLFSLEVLIADVHDGDAQVKGATIASLVSLDDPTGATDDIGVPKVPPRHAAHVCHCVHAHGVSVPAVVSLPPVPEVSRAAVQLVMRTPDQVDVDVHLRPPIA